MERPDVDSVEGLSPSIAIEQKTTTRSPRSTVGTITEIYDYLRVVYSAIGTPHCPNCGKPITRQSTEQIVQSVLALKPDDRIMVLAPVVRGRKGEYKKELEKYAKEGYVRARVDGDLVNLDEPIPLDRRKNHTIEIVVDRLLLKNGIAQRLEQSVETALKLTGGLVTIVVVGGEEHVYSEKLACPDCGISVPQLEPRSFSFNSPYGACPECHGLGSKYDFDPAKVIVDWTKPLFEGGLGPGSGSTYLQRTMRLAAAAYEFDLDAPFEQLSRKTQNLILHGNPAERQKCQAAQLSGPARASGIKSRRIEVRQLPRMAHAIHVARSLRRVQRAPSAPRKPRRENCRPLDRGFYRACRSPTRAPPWIKSARSLLCASTKLPAARSTKSPSASIFCSTSASAISPWTVPPPRFPAAKPSASAWQRKSARACAACSTCSMNPRSACTRATMAACSTRSKPCAISATPFSSSSTTKKPSAAPITWLISAPAPEKQADTSSPPAAPAEIAANPASLTGQYLSGKVKIAVPETRRSPNGKSIAILGAHSHNLKNIDVTLPLGLMTVVTGVSGSGKSTLINDILYRALAAKLYRSMEKPGAHRAITGIEHIDKVVQIDQAPIGRTPRSNPATYTGVFAPIRELYAMLPESRERGYRPGRFSFNVKGGRCEACQGDGQRRIEMNFLPDVYVTCEVCRGKRYNAETLAVRYKGLSISDLLDLPIEEALKVLENIPAIQIKLQTLVDVGLGYVQLGQSATTLSGGEAQRTKLARELSKRQTGRTLYILDEPTTGLHFDDVKKLLDVLNRLVTLGNTVLIIEHHLDVIKQADWIIDLGPEGGEEGGRIVAQGTPEQVARVKKSYTGQILARALNGNGTSSNGAHGAGGSKDKRSAEQ